MATMSMFPSYFHYFPNLVLKFDHLQLQSTTNDDGIPLAVRCSEDKLQDNQVFILENGVSMFLWIGQAVDPTLIQNVFGAQSAAQIDIDLVRG